MSYGGEGRQCTSQATTTGADNRAHKKPSNATDFTPPSPPHSAIDSGPSVQFFQLAALFLLLLLFHIKVLHQVRYVVVVVVRPSAGAGALLALLGRLIGFCELSQRRERVGAELVEDAWDELCELLDVSRAVDGECVSGYGGVD